MFEYKTMHYEPAFWKGKPDADNIEIAVNKLAAEGWRLISSTPIPADATGGAYAVIYVFERQK